MRHHTRTALLLAAILSGPLIASAIASRNRESGSRQTTIQTGHSTAADSQDAGNRPFINPAFTSTAATAVQFEVFKVQRRKSISELESRLGIAGFAAMLKINRTDRSHIRVGDSLVIPNSSTDLLNIAPFPKELEMARSIPKLVLVSRRVQAFGAYESGKLVNWGPTSTGKKSTPTPAGLFHTNWKAKEKRSSINQSWILPWCFNLDDFAGVAFHKFDLPGYPASHGCVRLLEEDAKWIYDWAEQWTLSRTDHSILAFGTPVVIFGDYSYGEKPLWKRLADDPGAAAVPLAEAKNALTQHLATIEIKALAGRPAKPDQITAAAAAAFPN